jgi:hypothetical protein
MLPCEPILDDAESFGPLICFAFHAKEEASVPKALQDVLWVIHSAMCVVHKGARTPYLDLKGRDFHVQFGGSPTEKPIIVLKDNHSVLPEIQIQIRVHTMGLEHYMVLIVRSHLAFSLRHAIVHVLTQSGLLETDERQIAINTHAKRMREQLGSSFFKELERSDSIDWLRVPNTLSFHILFSVMGAVQWIRAHYTQLHPEVGLLLPPLEGFGDLGPASSETTLLDPQFITQGLLYESNLDKLHFATHAEGGRQKKKDKRANARSKSKKQRSNRHGGGALGSPLPSCPSSPGSSSQCSNRRSEFGGDDDDEDPGGEGEHAENQREIILNMADLGVPMGWVLDEVRCSLLFSSYLFGAYAYAGRSVD